MNWTGCGKEEVNFDSLGQKRLQIIQPAMAAGRQVKTTHSRIAEPPSKIVILTF
jgi:hypothetical protein